MLHDIALYKFNIHIHTFTFTIHHTSTDSRDYTMYSSDSGQQVT